MSEQVERFEYDDGTFDELFATNATVHIERMNDGGLWMRVNDWHINVSAVKRGVLEVIVEDER